MTINRPVINYNSWPILISELPEDKQESIYLEARQAYKNLISIQFQLSYHAHISIEDQDNMTRYEYLMFYEELKTQKAAEEKAIKESQVASQSKKSGRR